MLPRYDTTRSYDWNYDHAPDPVDVDVPAVPGQWRFCGLPVASPLGIAAGPLLNGRWVLYYASLGFDVLTYKTVRTAARACYPLPNLLPVRADQVSGDGDPLAADKRMHGSWAISFGMPSRPPHIRRADVECTRQVLPADKLLSVSVVGTAREGGGLNELAEDYASAARWAVEAGADVVEANFSCPNVASADGQLFQAAKAAALVAERVRAAIGKKPLAIKIGHVTQPAVAEALVAAVEPYATALAMTNCIARRIQDAGGPLFQGERRGIGGEAIREASVDQVRMFADVLRRRKSPLELIGVGGASSADHVRAYLDAGAHAVHLATAAMLDPGVGQAIRKSFS